MSFLKSFLDDRLKEINPTHVIAAALTLAIIVWGSVESYHTHAMPSRLVDAGELLGIGAGALNVAHKSEDIIAKIKSAVGGGPPPAA